MRRTLVSVRTRGLATHEGLRHYPHTLRLATRWNDMDAFGHVNNVMYYAYMDNAVNLHLAASGVGLDTPRYVAQSGCKYLAPLSFPQQLEVGLRVERVGTSSVKYAIGIFGCSIETGEATDLAAEGEFVHVYVDGDGRAKPLSEHVRAVLAPLSSVANDQ